MSVAFYLGIDGGGSKTLCAVGDESSKLSTFTAGPCNISRVQEDVARASLHQAIHQACSSAGIETRQLRCSCIGVAGAAHADIAGAIRRIVAEVIPGPIQVVGDMQIALQAAFGEGPGVIVIAGTGSIAYGRDVHGTSVRAGGWGYSVSDEGSAHWIGRAAVASVLRQADEAGDHRSRRQNAPLFSELASAWKAASLENLARAANSHGEFAELFPAVVTASENGDERAAQILRNAGSELARLALIVVCRLFPDSARHQIATAMAGGVFRHAASVRDAFVAELRKSGLSLQLKPEIIEPVDGALQIARRSPPATNL